MERQEHQCQPEKIVGFKINLKMKTKTKPKIPLVVEKLSSLIRGFLFHDTRDAHHASDSVTCNSNTFHKFHGYRFRCMDNASKFQR